MKNSPKLSEMSDAHSIYEDLMKILEDDIDTSDEGTFYRNQLRQELREAIEKYCK